MRTIIWLNLEDVIEGEIERLTIKLRSAKRKKDEKAVKRIEKELYVLYNMLSVLD
jgi:hypothetical protein